MISFTHAGDSVRERRALQSLQQARSNNFSREQNRYSFFLHRDNFVSVVRPQLDSGNSGVITPGRKAEDGHASVTGLTLYPHNRSQSLPQNDRPSLEVGFGIVFSPFFDPLNRPFESMIHNIESAVPNFPKVIVGRIIKRENDCHG
jgi:hypothetical protein